MKVRIDGTEAMAMYAAAFRRMRALPGFDQKLILRAEAGTILKAWAGRTKVATPQVAEFRARYRAGKRAFGALGSASSNPYGLSVNTGVRGGVPGWVWHRNANGNLMLAGYISDDGQIHPNHTRHFGSADWGRIVSGMEAYADSLAREMQIAPQTIGFARQSVIQCADALNIDLATVAGGGISAAGIAKARKAIASNGRSYTNGSGRDGGDDIKSYVECISRLPYGGEIGMDRELAQILARRAKYIETSFRKGAFDSVSRAARAFPNVFRVVGSS